MRSDFKNSYFTDCNTRSEFFIRFKEGLKERMGREVKGDIPLDYKILHEILFHLKRELLDVETTHERRRWIASVGTLFTLTFVLGLRGNEILMLDLSGLINHIEQGKYEKPSYVVIPLLGKFKGEDYNRYHLLLAPDKTNSGFQPRLWVEWFIAAKKSQGFEEGPAFCDKEGYVLPQGPFNDELLDQLEWARDSFPLLFSKDMDLNRVRVSRSFRKGSTSRAQDLNLEQQVIDANNRWRSFDKAKGSRPNMNLRDHYSTVRLMSNKLLKYPQAM